jgi:uncharacterized protein
VVPAALAAALALSIASATMDHAATVQEIYAAFARGDIPAIIDRLADDVDWDGWEDNSAQRAGVPWLTARQGKDGVLAFFEEVAKFEIRDFEVRSVIASDHKVAVEVLMDNAKPGFRDEELHLWTFGPDGKVVGLRHYVDTAKHIAAAGGPLANAAR